MKQQPKCMRQYFMTSLLLLRTVKRDLSSLLIVDKLKQLYALTFIRDHVTNETKISTYIQ